MLSETINQTGLYCYPFSVIFQPVNEKKMYNRQFIKIK